MPDFDSTRDELLAAVDQSRAELEAAVLLLQELGGRQLVAS